MIWREIKIPCDDICRRLNIHYDWVLDYLIERSAMRFDSGEDQRTSSKNAVGDLFEYLKIIQKDAAEKAAGEQKGLL